ncbi:MAG TPA: Gfo/Idh/MocA family oxidoreductase [Candidatus Eisenbacteria bacterium]|nr:Gfo/Idh/MocA family oxidoreductase [Candidatus Eisenbacteria bacterium]
MSDGPLRIGILGAARIAPMALIQPARRNLEAAVVGIAARDPARAAAFATRYGIERAYGDYDHLLRDSAIEAVYNPLPNSLHAPWTIRALEAGKHVLCEKPFSATVAEAEAMTDAATREGRVLMEAFHYRYHPLFGRLRAIITSGEIGTVRHLEATFCIPLLRPSDIRWRADLAGGALMDTGCYAVHLLRHLSQAEPEIRSAQAAWTRGGVDRWLRAEMSFPSGASARLTCALLSARLLSIRARVIGSEGRIDVLNFVAPQFFHRLRVKTPSGSRSERVAGSPSYDYQLRAFVAAVRSGAAVPTGPADAIANMRAIAAIYRAAERSTR